MIQLWTISNLQRLDYSIRKHITFYAPLTESLDFYGVDPVLYSSNAPVNATLRGGIKTIQANIPIFEFSGDTALGLKLVSAISAALQFSASNLLNNSNTVIWFEDRVPRSTPSNGNPFNPSGFWTGASNVHISHIVKADSILANTTISQIQAALLDVPPQTFVTLPPPPVNPPGSFWDETPSGARNGANQTFTLTFTPDVNSLILGWAGLFVKRVASSPGTLEYTLSGKTITTGFVPLASHDLTANYVIAGP